MRAMKAIREDSYCKNGPRVWSAEDNPTALGFNRRMVAVNRMYGWLYAQGILQQVFRLADFTLAEE
jgi:hypothetical protein